MKRALEVWALILSCLLVFGVAARYGIASPALLESASDGLLLFIVGSYCAADRDLVGPLCRPGGFPAGPISFGIAASIVGACVVIFLTRGPWSLDIAMTKRVIEFVRVAAFPGVVEELGFRGVILMRLSRVMPFRHALIVQALMFALLHFGPAVGGALALGLFAGSLTRFTRSIYPGMAIHVAWNGWLVLST